MTPLDRNVIVDGVRIAYRYRGGDGPPLVLLHGTPSHSAIWRHVIPELEAGGHSVLAYDLLGFGESERPVDRDTSVTAQAGLLGELLTTLGIDRCVLVAHDIGGAIGQIFATSRPDRVDGLVLVDPVSYDSWPSETWRRVIRDHLGDYAAMPRQDFEAMLTRQLRMTVSGEMAEEVLETYLAPHRGPVGRVSFFEHQVRHYDSAPTERVAPLLGGLPMPVRILWGEDDRWQPVAYGERLASDIPHAELVTVPGAGHFLMEDRPHRVAEEILRFASRLSQSRSA
ncbi:alpha/beta hydrolase [Saccharopolyspora erythraea]|uniref:alpha/beta fold hydrolase n=1 Tax=Saccharopolyspora erythraea TaxID=1836 RepID=UPI001BF0C562|nr:alpha/beta hydrolase [Saccharopolyspora erythraea]QUH01400.1 alpha/beta hydrolase [Saccharopolyspora erythraea]